MDMVGVDTKGLAEKIEEALKKRTNLIELYAESVIDKSEFTRLRKKYDNEIESLKSMAESIEKQQAMINKQQELMADIKKAIDELVSGIQYEDEFYTQILDKMVINDRENIDVYLNLLPYKWSYTVAKSINCTKGALELPKKAEASDYSISEASLPISVSSPLSSG